MTILAFYGKNSLVILGTHVFIIYICDILGFYSLFLMHILSGRILCLLSLLVIVMGG